MPGSPGATAPSSRRGGSRSGQSPLPFSPMSPLKSKAAALMLPNSPPHFEDTPPRPDLPPTAFMKPPRRRCMSSSALFRGSSAPTSPLVSPPRPIYASGGVAAVALSQTLSELSLSPPPGKIRRRNALTQSELFFQSREMQSLQDRYRLHFLRGRGLEPPGGLADGKLLQKEFDNLSLDASRRKKATPRPTAHPSQEPPTARRRPATRHTHGERMVISLHKDLRSFRPPGPVPPSLALKYVPPPPAQSQALMLYRAPPTLLHSILPPTSEPSASASKVPPAPDEASRPPSGDTEMS